MEVISKGKYLVPKKEERMFSQILLSKTSYPEGLRSEWHYHENPYFTLILSGGSQEQRKNSSLECKPGQVLFYNWQEPHKNGNYQRESRNFNIELDAVWMKESGINVKSVEETVGTRSPDVRFMMLKIFKEFLLNDTCSPLSVHQLTLALFGAMNSVNKSRHNPPWLIKLVEILNDKWSENLSLKELSEILDVHPVTISKYCPKYFNCTLGEYVRKIRINKALDLLSSKKMSLSQIAYESGFADQSHFIRNFKEQTGFLPNSFRKALVR
jgi:AraC family transcriptional regulator